MTVGCEIAATSRPCIFQGFDQVLPSVEITTSIFIISKPSSVLLYRKTNKSWLFDPIIVENINTITLRAERTKKDKRFYEVPVVPTPFLGQVQIILYRWVRRERRNFPKLNRLWPITYEQFICVCVDIWGTRKTGSYSLCFATWLFAK